MVVRYGIMSALAAAALYALIVMGQSNGEWVLVDAGAGAGNPQDFSFWLLAAIALLTSLSLGRFVVFGIPSMLGGWYQSNKQWIYTLVFGGLACGVFYLM